MGSQIRSIEYVRSIPELSSSFEILERKGQGTFASVFTVKSKQDPSSEILAMKMIIPTVELRRVENEIRALRQLKGKHGVVKMLSAMRVRDHIFILMPFVDYIAFSNYYLSLNEKEIRRYLLHLLRALEHVHRFGIIHRDVKPTNFLLDRHSRRYTLVDFGLAHSQTHGDLDANWNPSNDNQSTASPAFFNREPKNASKRPRLRLAGEDFGPAKVARMYEGFGTPVLFNTGAGVNEKSIIKPATYPRFNASSGPGGSIPGSSLILPTTASSTSIIATASSVEVQCCCRHRLTVCRGCRALQKAPAARRGGTLGFRPPEVMLRCTDQTTAIDLWAVGVIFLSFLTGRYPFVKVNDDLEVLHVFTYLLGYERMQRGAYSVGRRLLVDPKPPPLGDTETPLSFLKKRLIGIRKLERRLVAPPPPLATPTGNQEATSPIPATTSSPLIALPNTHRFPSPAYDLVARLLEPSPHRRITATEALQHPFIRGGSSGRFSQSKEPSVPSSTTTLPVFSLPHPRAL